MAFILTGQIRDHGGPGVRPPVLISRGPLVLVNPRMVDPLGGAMQFPSSLAAINFATALPGRWRAVEVDGLDRPQARIVGIRERPGTAIDFDGDLTDRG